MKVAVSAILRDLCQGCDVYPENFEKTNLNCSTSGLAAYFSIALVYSNSDGTIVASTLIDMLLSWLLSEDTSRITVSGSSFDLSKQCLTLLTMSTCIDLFNSDNVGAVSHEESNVNISISFSIGIITGIIICITVIAIIIW